MTDPELQLFHSPGACSRVSVCALEWAGLPYRLSLVDVARNEQAGEAYKAVSAMGKIPALLIDGEPLLENAAIITLVHALRPDAGILPPDDDPRARAEGAGGLSFCGGTLPRRGLRRGAGGWAMYRSSMSTSIGRSASRGVSATGRPIIRCSTDWRAGWRRSPATSACRKGRAARAKHLACDRRLRVGSGRDGRSRLSSR